MNLLAQSIFLPSEDPEALINSMRKSVVASAINDSRSTINISDAQLEGLIDPTTILGFYTQKRKQKITSIGEFISQLQTQDCLSQFGMQSDLEFAGIRKVLQLFMDKVRSKISENPVLKSDIHAQMDEVTDYVMKILYPCFF